MNKNMNNTPEATNRNRHEDALKIDTTLKVLRKTIEIASHYNEYKDDFNVFKASAIHNLVLAPSMNDNEVMTVSGIKYTVSVGGIEAMLKKLDELSGKFDIASNAKNKLNNAAEAYAKAISDALGEEVNTTGKCNNENAGSPCSHCCDHGNKEVCVACADCPADEKKDTEEINMLNAFKGKLEELLDKMEDADEDFGEVVSRINAIERAQIPPIRIPAESCDEKKLLRLGIRPNDEVPKKNEMESIDIPEINVATGDINAVDANDVVAIDANDINAIQTGDIKVGRIGNNVNIRVDNLVINEKDE